MGRRSCFFLGFVLCTLFGFFSDIYILLVCSTYTKSDFLFSLLICAIASISMHFSSCRNKMKFFYWSTRDRSINQRQMTMEFNAHAMFKMKIKINAKLSSMFQVDVI